MFTIEETNEMLDEIADSLPFELYRDLNGGIVLLPEEKIHPKAIDNDLFIMGEYCTSSIGRYTKIYYGSFCRVYGHVSREAYREHLRKVLVHEVRHHCEGLAGYKDLILYDEDQIDAYLRRKQKQKEKGTGL